MACRNAYRTRPVMAGAESAPQKISEPVVAQKVSRLFFGVDSKTQAHDLLQNNIDMFEWVVRNKIPPNFYGRNIVGEKVLTKKEIEFLHIRGVKIAAIYSDSGEKVKKEAGIAVAKKAVEAATKLEIPTETAIFLEIADGETLTRDFLLGFAKTLISVGYTPAFKASTDAKYVFDREFSRGLQTDKEVFNKCLIWAVSPTLAEYNGMTTTHLIHPDVWRPFAPSGITREQIAVWQYGNNCHPIADDAGAKTTFDLNLVRNIDVIINKMF